MKDEKEARAGRRALSIHRIGNTASIGQQQPVRNDLFFQRLAVHLKASQHRPPAIDESLSLE